MPEAADAAGRASFEDDHATSDLHMMLHRGKEQALKRLRMSIDDFG